MDAVIAAGGDGTFSEVVGALAIRKTGVDALPTLGLIQPGTARLCKRGPVTSIRWQR